MNERALSDSVDYNNRVRKYNKAYEKGYHDYDYASNFSHMYKNDYEFVAYCVGWNKKKEMKEWLKFRNNLNLK